MKLLFDFLPILVFFIVYKFFGIYIATGAAIVVSILQVTTHLIRHRHVPGLQLLSLGLIVILGGGTLLLHNELLIKWKPTALYWIMAILFLGSQFLSEKTFIQRLMDSTITLPRAIWLKLNLAWVIFFSIMGAINIYVAYHYATNTWVNFKLFGMLGLTLVFAIAQACYLARHIDTTEKNSNP